MTTTAQPRTSSRSIFDISSEMLEIRDLMEGFDGDVSDDTTEALFDALFEVSKDNEEEFDRKVDSYIWLIKELRMEGETAKAESVRLAAIHKTRNNHADRLEKRLEEIFKKLDIRERKTKYHNPKFGFPGGKQAVTYNLEGWVFPTDDYTEEGKQVIPECFVVKKPEINKELVREELENGGTVPFAVLEPRKEKLKIK